MEILYLPPADSGDGRILVDGTDVSDHIGTAEIGSLASAVSAIPAVRRRLVAIQQQTGANGRVVMDGRDIGSMVFPEADVKFYLDAGLPIRAERRRLELQERGERLLQAEVEQQLAGRDHADATRADSPLVRTADSQLVDSGKMGPEEVVGCMIRKMHRLIC